MKRIFDETKTTELLEYDKDAGYLVPDRLFIAHHDAVEAVAEQGHWETIAEYPNGGKDVAWIVDVKGVEAQEAYDEYEDIFVFKHFTKTELAQKKISELISFLQSWDYKTCKRADGDYTDEEWAEIAAQRKAWRAEINALEAEIAKENDNANG